MTENIQLIIDALQQAFSYTADKAPELYPVFILQYRWYEIFKAFKITFVISATIIMLLILFVPMFEIEYEFNVSNVLKNMIIAVVSLVILSLTSHVLQIWLAGDYMFFKSLFG